MDMGPWAAGEQEENMTEMPGCVLSLLMIMSHSASVLMNVKWPGGEDVLLAWPGEEPGAKLGLPQLSFSLDGVRDRQ